MIDLRLFANELIGKTFKVRAEDRRIGAATKEVKYTIKEVYPFHVAAHYTCENGNTFREAFSIGDLVQMGLLKSGRGYIGDGYRLYRGV